MGEGEILFILWKLWVTITCMALYWKVFLAKKDA